MTQQDSSQRNKEKMQSKEMKNTEMKQILEPCFERDFRRV